MKEYIAETGGRYTYSDDILNLQELALSMSAVFDGCSDFIISGCEIEGPRVSPGYVWLGGKVRRFDAAPMLSIPIIYTKSTGMNRWSTPMRSTSAGVPVISVPEPRLSRIRSIRLLTNCRRPSR